VGSEHGLSNAQLDAVTAEWRDQRSLFTVRQAVALAYADAMTLADVDDDLFAAVAAEFDPDELVELTATIAWENSSARFNRALRVPSQGLWTRSNDPPPS
jgi:alkylhydroperoxidase family enzyme